MAKRIDCFVAGVQKAGTTSLFALLSRHPQLATPTIKELHFFDDETRDWETPDYAALEAFYDADADGMRFDSTPIYSYWPQSMERIQRYNPSAKIILQFRDPLARAYSHWCMQYGRGWETLPFASAIREGRSRLDGADARALRIFSYVERGRYGSQLRRALALFPREQILLLTAEAFARDQACVLDRISAFLGIDPFETFPPVRDHKRPDIAYPSVPDDADRRLVFADLNDEMRELAELSQFQVRYTLEGEGGGSVAPG